MHFGGKIMKIFNHGSILFGLLAFSAATDPAGAQTVLAAAGGGGGVHFSSSCGASGWVMSGLSMRVGSWVDSVKPICVGANFPDRSADRKVVEPNRGGAGGGPKVIECWHNAYAIRGVAVSHGTGNNNLRVVTGIKLLCGTADGLGGLQTPPNGAFQGTSRLQPRTEQYVCPKGEVVTAIYGRSGIFLDSIGVVCTKSPLSR